MVSGQYRQQVVRPDVVGRGADPPWSDLPAPARRAVALERVRARFHRPPLATSPVVSLGPGATEVISAVMVPIVERDGEASVVLIRRAAGLGLDPGHIAFPGGHREEGEDPLETALRESEEEVGLDRHELEVLGPLGVVERARDRQRVAAFLGILSPLARLVPNADEVEAILEIPLAGLLADGVGWEEQWGEGPRPRRLKFFASDELLGDDLIWGLTAGILWDLLGRLTA